MELSALLLLLTVIVTFSECVPVGTTTPSQRRETKANVRFPTHKNTATMRPLPYDWARGSNSTSSRTGVAEEPFVFPEDESPKIPTPKPPKLAPRFKPTSAKRAPPCARGSTYCTDVNNYPGEYLQDVFKNSAYDFDDLLGTDELKKPPLTQRFDGDDNVNENSLCTSLEEIVYPKTAKTKDDKWLYVVNQADYVQGVRVEKCIKSGGSNDHSCLFAESFPIGYKTTCKQKYIYRRLVALNDDGKPITDTFQLPSCCICTVISDLLNSRVAPAGKRTSNGTTSISTTSKPK